MLSEKQQKAVANEFRTFQFCNGILAFASAYTTQKYEYLQWDCLVQKEVPVSNALRNNLDEIMPNW